ncbi:MAG: STAS domain-containing protein [Campylobacterales bacterium]|nr:STAS domain-containing protein [Campylobacterales bacterium]
MNEKFKTALLDIVQNSSQELTQHWLEYFEDEFKDDEYRRYDDFLGFFEECIESNLDPLSDEAGALKHFLKKVVDIIGEDYFFHFHNSVYTCFLKFPLLKVIEQKGMFTYENVKPITAFFESLTSTLVVELLQQHKSVTLSSTQELAEREAPISEIWDGVLMVSIVGTLDSFRILQIIDKVLTHLEKKEYAHAIVDISAIYDMNSEVANQIIKLNNTIHFMGVTPYITGITPNIAKSLTHLNINLGEVKTYVTTKKAMKIILGQDS